MDASEIAKLIRTMPLFHALSAEQLTLLARDARERTIAPNELVLTQDHEGREMFVVVEGELQAFVRDDAANFERALRHYFPGEHFGELAVVTDQRRSASIRAITPCRVVVLHKQSIDRLMDSSPDFSRALLRAMSWYIQSNLTGLAAFPFARLDSFPELQSASGLLPVRIARFCQALAVQQFDEKVTVAMVDPSDVHARSFIKDVLRHFQVEFVAISEDDFDLHATKLLRSDDSFAVQAGEEPLTFVNSEGERSEILTVGGSDLFSRMLGAAMQAGASDVHIEPDEKVGRIRLRIDGKLLTWESGIPMPKFNQLSGRIKVMAELDITNVRRPQDGRFMVERGSRRVECRVSVTPCQGGEKTVLRLLESKPNLSNIGNLILSRPVAMFASSLFDNPSGLVLVTGPTGSGKTTTLYAALESINDADGAMNIVTIEDPVEKNLPFATQIQINPELELTFATILRTVLRQDPDVVLVGEIRDRESAQIALEAATTGHFVLSSLHTYSALETIVRLRDLEAPPYLLASALKGVISQKLVPRLCPGCTVDVAEDDPVIETLSRLGALPEDWRGKLQRGVSIPGGPTDGESGRVGVYEVLSISDAVRDMIDRNATVAEIRGNLLEDSFVSSARYSRFLLSQGIVSPQRITEIFPKKMHAAQA